MSPVHHFAELLATLTCGIFAGAAIYINVGEHPARLECGTKLAATVFPGSYRRAAALQAPLALLSLIFSIISYSYGSSYWFVVAGILIGSVVPFTFLFIMPTNKILLDPKNDKESAATKGLLIKWGRLHAVRSVLSFAAFIIFLYNL